MDTLLHADVFFFVTTIAVILIATVIVIAFIYIIQILKNLRDVSRVFKKGTDKAGESIEAIINLIINNKIFQMFFGKKTPRTKRKTNKKNEEKN